MRIVTRIMAAIVLCVSAATASPAILGKLRYNVEWRHVRAGSVMIEAGQAQGRIKIDSGGPFAALYKVNDTYTVRYAHPFCATETALDTRRGKRHRLTTVSYDHEAGYAEYIQRDVVKDEVRESVRTEVPACVHDVLGGVLALREITLQPGQSTLLPLSNGRRSARIRIEAQEREEVVTPAGVFKAIRYEAGLMNGVIYERGGRAFVWLTDDERRLPVQMRVRMSFPVGTVTLQLQKEESK